MPHNSTRQEATTHKVSYRRSRMYFLSQRDSVSSQLFYRSYEENRLLVKTKSNSYEKSALAICLPFCFFFPLQAFQLRCDNRTFNLRLSRFGTNFFHEAITRVGLEDLFLAAQDFQQSFVNGIARK